MFISGSGFGASGYSGPTQWPLFAFLYAWRVGGLSKWVISRLISTLKGVLIGVMILYKSIK